MERSLVASRRSAGVILSLVLLALCWPAVFPAATQEQGRSPILAAYDFESGEATGPDTFRIFEHATGSVDLSESFRVSGLRSLQIREEPGNGCFSELLGFLPEQQGEVLYVQLYLLFTDLDEELNFALAGPRWFLNLQQHGNAFWLSTHDGMLWHRPAGHWSELFAPRPFTWYFLDLAYDVTAGRYDLAIHEEGIEEPVVDLYRQRNTSNADRSKVEYYSFIGDLEDESSAVFYGDDLLIATDPAQRLPPFVAPGRRQFFVERLSLTAGEEKRVLEEQIAEARQVLRRGVEAETLTIEQADRLEAAADEAFRQRDLDLAEELYGLLASVPDRQLRALLKSADVAYLRGDLSEERSMRERIYGRLELEGHLERGREAHAHP